MGVGGCKCPISIRVRYMDNPCWAFMNTPASLVLAADAATCFITWYNVCTVPFNRIGCPCCGTDPRK
eukprot:3743765-Ditylum_brightwellii.AAC.1